MKKGTMCIKKQNLYKKGKNEQQSIENQERNTEI